MDGRIKTKINLAWQIGLGRRTKKSRLNNRDFRLCKKTQHKSCIIVNWTKKKHNGLILFKKMFGGFNQLLPKIAGSNIFVDFYPL